MKLDELIRKFEEEILSLPVEDPRMAIKNRDSLIDIRQRLFDTTFEDAGYKLPKQDELLCLCAKYNRTRGEFINITQNNKEATGISDWPKYFHSLPARIYAHQARGLFRKISKEVLDDFRDIISEIFLPLFIPERSLFKISQCSLGNFSPADILCLYSKELFLTYIHSTQQGPSYHLSFECKEFPHVCHDITDLLQVFSRIIEDAQITYDPLLLDFVKEHVITDTNRAILKNNQYFVQLNKVYQSLISNNLIEK